MDLQYLRRLVKIFDESKATELLLEEDGLKLKLAKKDKNTIHITPQHTGDNIIPQVTNFSSQKENYIEQVNFQSQSEPLININKETNLSISDEESKYHKIYSPLVGTFYRAPSPDSEPFVQIGSHVNPGSTLCIIEAMKLMNELESDISGTVIKILQENGQPVEYNQLLFLIKPD